MRHTLPPAARSALALGAVLLLGCLFNPAGAFFALRTHMDLLMRVSVVGILALGMTPVILTGGIDLSVGSLLALTGMVFAGLTLTAELPWPLAAAAAVAAGTALGTGTGTMIARYRLQPFIVTLAAMVIARGLAKYLPDLAGLAVGSKFMPANVAELPPFYETIASRIAGVPVLGLLFALLALALGTAMRRTTFGRHVLAVGGNERAAVLAGIPTARVKTTAYALSGACAGLAGIGQTVLDRHGNPSAGMMFELQAIAAVVIGGTSLMGGRGGIGLTVLGVLTIGYIEKILSLNGVQEHWRLVIQGGIILAAVLLQDRR